jgi:GNAT superfamily N-acetyltransferase
MHAIERISLDAYTAAYGPAATRVAGATCLRAPQAPDSPMLNRVVGLDTDGPVDESTLDEALAAMGDASFYVAVSPSADASLDTLLEARGLEQGWGWMMFERGPSPPPSVETALRVVEVDAGTADAWAGVVATAYGLPDDARPWFAAIPEATGWHAFLALDGDAPVAAAAVWIDGDAAYFGMAGTMPEHRGKGGQGALFAVRIERALAAGCRRLVTETGELREGSPSSSYRNIRRHGFEERFVVAHRLRPRDSG